MLSDTERDNPSDTFKKIEEYPWSVKSVTIKWVTYKTTTFIKLVLKYKTGTNLLTLFGCSSQELNSQIKLFKELPEGSIRLNNKFLFVIGKRFCTKCENIIPLNELGDDWYRCKNCEKLQGQKYRKEYYIKNKEKMLSYSKEYYRNNSEARKEYNREWNRKNKKYRQLYRKIYYLNNKDLFLSWTAKRKAATLQRVPLWQTEEHASLILDFYKNCPEGYHVDHIVPLQGKLVSGLHTIENLQYLPATENLSKGNSFDPEKFNS